MTPGSAGLVEQADRRGAIRQVIGESVSSEGLRQAFLTILFAGVLAAAVYGLWSIPD